MRVRFVVHPIRGPRIHHVTPSDVEVVLGRLPEEVLKPLKEVHFNDRMGTRGCLGYANPGSGCLALCALPERVSFAHYLERQECRAAEFGASAGSQWPNLAVRRFILYYVLLHELGHLQVLLVKGRRHGRVPGERMAREFGNYWRRKLWSEPFDHSDGVHNPPAWDPWRPFPHQMVEDGRYGELIQSLLAAPQYERPEWHRDLGHAYAFSGFYEQAEFHYIASHELEPDDAWILRQVGWCRKMLGRYRQALEPLLEAHRNYGWDPSVARHLAYCLWMTGEKQLCDGVLAHAVTLFPDDVPLGVLHHDVRRALR